MPIGRAVAGATEAFSKCELDLGQYGSRRGAKEYGGQPTRTKRPPGPAGILEGCQGSNGGRQTLSGKGVRRLLLHPQTDCRYV